MDLIFPRQSDEARDLAWAAARAKVQELGEDRAFAKVWAPLQMHSRSLLIRCSCQDSLLQYCTVACLVMCTHCGRRHGL